MIRLLICALMVLCGGYIGFAASRRAKSRLNELSLCEALLGRISDYLCYEKLPTNRIITALCNTESFLKLRFLSGCQKKLTEGECFPLAWSDALNEAKPTQCLIDEDYPPLLGLAEVIGAYDAGAQENAIALAQMLIKEQREQAAAEYEKTGKLYRSLGVLGGLAVAIIII